MDVFQRLFRRLDGSLRARILLPTAVLFAVTLAAMVFAAVRLYAAELEKGRRERAELFTSMLATGVSNAMLAGEPGRVPELLDALRAHRADVVAVSLIAPSGQVNVTTEAAMLGTRPWGELGAIQDTTTVQRPGDHTQFAVLHPVRNAPACARCHDARTHTNGWLDVRFSRAPVVQAERGLARTLSLTATGALVCLLAIAMWLVGREAIEPLQRLVAAMRDAGTGDRAVRADEGRPDEIGVAARGFDATLAALRKSQAELEAFYNERMLRADRFAAVGEVATGLAHEIKNPLAGLSGALELLAEDLGQDPRHAEFVAEMRHQVERLTKTMESLLSFARPAKPKLRPTNVNAAIEKVLFLIRQQCRGSSVLVEADLAAGLQPVLADASQLEQVLLNLCLNACQAMHACGIGTLTVRTRHRDGNVAVDVQDTGPGIAVEEREQVFKPFFTTKREGNGLGLAISAQIVTEHGGHIAFRCPPEGGTIFTITLQPAPAEPAPLAEQAA